MIERPVILETARVRLEPLRRDHVKQLAASCHDPRCWEWTYQTSPFGDERATATWFEAATAADQTTFAIVDRDAECVVGSTRFYDVFPEHRKLEIGWTVLAPAYWRTHVNTHAKYLMLRHAFETWGMRRVQFKADGRNARSHTAILRLGATHEGTLRAYRIQPETGRAHDAAFFSILADEWPAAKERLERALRRTEAPISA